MSDQHFAFPALEIEKKSGDETFRGVGSHPEMRVNEFWRWAASDLLSNAMRGVLAEYIVANALGLAGGVRKEWDAFDLRMDDGTRVEVKSAAYLQSWHQRSLSLIQFGIQPTKGWDAETNLVSTERKRQADAYVFCLLAHKDQDSIDPLNLDQWEFYILRSDVLDRECPMQKSISLSRLLKLGPATAKYNQIASTIAGLV
ncbi:MAG: hypothetical protein WBO10_09150 [Pyrinomonadaceae bacterium]